MRNPCRPWWSVVITLNFGSTHPATYNPNTDRQITTTTITTNPLNNHPGIVWANECVPHRASLIDWAFPCPEKRARGALVVREDMRECERVWVGDES